MATVKISELEEVTTLSNSDALPIINENQTKKVSFEKLMENTATKEYVDNATVNTKITKYITWGKGEDVIGDYPEDQKTIINELITESFSNWMTTTSQATITLESDYAIYTMLEPFTVKGKLGKYIFYEYGGVRKQYNSKYCMVVEGSWSGNDFVCSSMRREVRVDYLPKDNVDIYTPTEDYHPATKKYVDEHAGSGGGSGSVDLTNYYTKDEVEVLIDENTPGAKIYVAKDVYSLVTASPSNITKTSAGGQNIIAAAQRAYDNGDYTFRLRMYATDPKLVPEYIDTVWTIPESGTGTITETAIKRYVFSTVNPNTIKYYYFSRTGITISDGVVSATGTYVGSMYYKEETNVTGSNITNYGYATTSEMNTALATKQPLLTAGDNITIDENNVISASGGGSASTFVWDGSTGAEALATFQEWWLQYLNTGILYPITWVDSLTNRYEGGYLLQPWMEYHLKSAKYIYVGFTSMYGHNNAYWHPDVKQFAIRLDLTDTIANGGTVSSFAIVSDQRSGLAAIYKSSGTYAETNYNYCALSLGNGSEFTPTGDYNPATKKYVDDGLLSKQNTLIAGDNITITDNVISATGGTSEDSGSSKPIFIWNGSSTDANAIAVFQEWYDYYLETGELADIYTNNDPLKCHTTTIGYRSGTKVYVTIWGLVDISDSNPQPALSLYAVQLNFSDSSSNTITSISIIIKNINSPLAFAYHTGYGNINLNRGALLTNNSIEFTPTGDYNPATKKYVDDAIISAITSVLEAEY